MCSRCRSRAWRSSPRNSRWACRAPKRWCGCTTRSIPTATGCRRTLNVGEPIVKPKGIDDVPIVTLTLWTPDADARRLRPGARRARARGRVEARARHARSGDDRRPAVASCACCSTRSGLPHSSSRPPMCAQALLAANAALPSGCAERRQPVDRRRDRAASWPMRRTSARSSSASPAANPVYLSDVARDRRWSADARALCLVRHGSAARRPKASARPASSRR